MQSETRLHLILSPIVFKGTYSYDSAYRIAAQETWLHEVA